MKVTTVVSFNSSDSTDYVFNVELDDVLNVNANGDVITTFDPSDVAYLAVNRSNNVSITDVAVTDGTITQIGTVSRTGTAANLFTSRDIKEADEFTLSVIPTSSTVSYIGKIGHLTLTTTSVGQWKYTPDQSLTPFLCKFDYAYNALSYKLTPPILVLEEDETYDIGVVFYIEVD